MRKSTLWEFRAPGGSCQIDKNVFFLALRVQRGIAPALLVALPFPKAKGEVGCEALSSSIHEHKADRQLGNIGRRDASQRALKESLRRTMPRFRNLSNCSPRWQHCGRVLPRPQHITRPCQSLVALTLCVWVGVLSTLLPDGLKLEFLRTT